MIHCLQGPPTRGTDSGGEPFRIGPFLRKSLSLQVFRHYNVWTIYCWKIESWVCAQDRSFEALVKKFGNAVSGAT
jgi:hypothetical protein